MRRLLVLLMLWSPLAQAQMMTPIVWDAPAGYEGPGDIVAYTAWYGLRGYSQAFALPGTGLAVRIRRASDNAETDLVILSNGDLDQATCTSFCNATTCFTRTLYDQTGGNACSAASCDLVQTGASNQPQFFCTGGGGDTTRPYIEGDDNGPTRELVGANNFAPNAAATMSGSLVVNVTQIITLGSTLFQSNKATNTTGLYFDIDTSLGVDNWRMNGLIGAANRGTWHAANGRVEDGAADASALDIDGTQVTGTKALSTSAGKPRAVSVSASDNVVHFGEAGFQDNALWSDPTLAALCHNMRLYWGTPGTC